MYCYLIAPAAAPGGRLLAYDTGFISGGLLFLRRFVALSLAMQRVVVGICLLDNTGLPVPSVKARAL